MFQSILSFINWSFAKLNSTFVSFSMVRGKSVRKLKREKPHTQLLYILQILQIHNWGHITQVGHTEVLNSFWTSHKIHQQKLQGIFLLYKLCKLKNGQVRMKNKYLKSITWPIVDKGYFKKVHITIQSITMYVKNFWKKR